ERVLKARTPEETARVAAAIPVRRLGEPREIADAVVFLASDAAAFINGTTVAVAIDMHRGHLDPAVATLPLPAERCGPLIKRAAALLAGLRERAVPVVHVVTEYRDPAEIAVNPFWKAAHDDPGKARRGILRHNLRGNPGTEIIAELHDPRDLVVRGKKRYSSFEATNLDFRVVIAADAVDSMDGEDMHRFALRLMQAALGWPLGNEDIFQA